MNTLIALLVLAAGPALAGPSIQASLRLEGDSTLHKFDSTATKVEVTADFSTTAAKPGDALALAREGSVKGLDVVIPVDGLKSHSGQLDKNMRKALKGGDFPALRFHMKEYHAEAKASGGETIRASGELTIAGVTKPIDLLAEAETAKEGVLVRGRQELLMSDYGIKPPQMMMGAIKTKDKIVIDYELRLLP